MLKKPEEYLEKASTFTSHLGTVGLTKETVLVLIARVQRETVEALERQIAGCEMPVGMPVKHVDGFNLGITAAVAIVHRALARCRLVEVTKKGTKKP